MIRRGFAALVALCKALVAPEKTEPTYSEGAGVQEPKRAEQAK